MKFSIFLLAATLSCAAAQADPTRVACIGDSITRGVGSPAHKSYPDQLQQLLGADYKVGNFGNSGSTLLRNGSRPYWKQKDFGDALKFKPDIAVIMLGTNDSNPVNYPKHQAEFVPDYQWLVEQLRQASPAVKIFICRPTPIPGGKKPRADNEPVLQQELPVLDKFAADMHLPEIDMHAALEGHENLFPDGLHPNEEGAGLMARTAAAAITGKSAADFQPATSASSPAR